MFDSSPACMPRLCFWLPGPIRSRLGANTSEVSRFSYVQFLDVLMALGLRRACGDLRYLPSLQCCLPVRSTRSAPGLGFRSSIPGPSMPLSTLHLAPHEARRKTRGQDGSLFLSCGALSSPTVRRFIPTLALLCSRGSVNEFRVHLYRLPIAQSDPRPRGSGLRLSSAPRRCIRNRSFAVTAPLTNSAFICIAFQSLNPSRDRKGAVAQASAVAGCYRE
jgi:hypothetical protein